ncbi:hypothetical protein CSB09_02440 [Candidatus Gracilibacteria bacterium]|nr:MAG: hypothetical protein CSB09_02440 [Candidatus Gracilibacteria bacterium]
MTFFQKTFLGLAVLFGFTLSAFANHPFTDIPRQSPYYDAVNALYTNGILKSDESNLFHPEAPMRRDFFVSLVVGVGCKKCTTPSGEDIRKYMNSPYIDLPKTNPYYYCIAYADDKDIVQGYGLDARGQASCENGTVYTSVPFCAENTISRIEAVAILLRRSGLWNDTLNENYTDRSFPISDVSTYWYGYAKKAIELGLITKRDDDSIGQDEKISRGEFTLMTSKVLDFTQCNPSQNEGENTISSQIVISQNGTPVQQTEFGEGEACKITPVTSQPGDWIYEWSIINRNGDQKKLTQKEISCADFNGGTSDIQVTLIDPSTNTPVSTATTTVNIIPSSGEVTGLGVLLNGDPLRGTPDTNFVFTTTISQTPNPTKKYIDYNDGSIAQITDSNTVITQTHKYKNSGLYTVTVTVTDTKNGKTGQSAVVVRVLEDDDFDDDGVPNDKDDCPRIRGTQKNNGCPLIDTGDHNCRTRQLYGESVTCDDENGDDDGDGDDGDGDGDDGDGDDGDGDDGDGDGTPDTDDRCPQTPGPRYNAGCPETHTPNACLLRKTKNTGIVRGRAVCEQCPCDNTLSISSPVRECDILFPTILSPDKSTVYSRGSFYLVQ